jgi:hypothetical protein
MNNRTLGAMSAILVCLVACGAPGDEGASENTQSAAQPMVAGPADPPAGGVGVPGAASNAQVCTVARPTAEEVAKAAAVRAAEEASSAADEALKLADEAYKLAQQRAASAPSSAVAREALEKAANALGLARSVVMQRQAELVAKRTALRAATELLDNLVGKCCSGAKWLCSLPVAVTIEILSNPGVCQAAEVERRPSCEAIARTLVEAQARLDAALTANAQNINAMTANRMACSMNQRPQAICDELAERYRRQDEEFRALIPLLQAEVAAAQAELNYCATCRVAEEQRRAP